MIWSKEKLQSLQLSFLFGLTLAGYPAIAAMSAILGFNNRTGSIALKLLLLGVCATMLLRWRWRYPRSDQLGLWFLVLFFWLLYVIRLVWDAYLVSSLLTRDPHDYLFFAIGTCFIPMLAFMISGGANARIFEKVRAVSLASVLLSSAMVLWVYYQSVDLSAAGIGSRLGLEALNPISAGHLGGSLVILSSFCLLERRTRGRRPIQDAYYCFALAVGMVLLVSSASRGPVVATTFALCVYGVSRLDRKNGVLNFLAVGTFFLAGIWLASLVESKLGFSSMSRIINLIEMGGSDASASVRLSLISAAWDQFLSSPLFGSGLEERYSRFYPHNVIVEAFMATGIFGGIAFLALLIAASLYSWRLLIKRSQSGWIAMLCIQYLIAGQFSGSLWGNSGMWSLIGGVFAVSQSGLNTNRYFVSAQAARH